MAYSTTITIDQTNLQLVKQNWPSTIDVESSFSYEYRRKVYAPASNEFASITGPIRRKSMIKSILFTDMRGGDITKAEYASAMAEIASSLTL